MSTRRGCCVNLSPHGPVTVYAGLCELVPFHCAKRLSRWLLLLGTTYGYRSVCLSGSHHFGWAGQGVAAVPRGTVTCEPGNNAVWTLNPIERESA